MDDSFRSHPQAAGATELAEEHNCDDTHTQVADGGCAAAAAAPYYGSYQPPGYVSGSAAGGWGTQSHPREPQSGSDPAADGYASRDAECFGGSQPLAHVSPPDDPLDGLQWLFGDDDRASHPIADPSMHQQTPQYPHTHYGFPPYQIPQLAPTAGDAPNVSTERAPETTIGERLRLVEEFERRKQSGERISMAQFAKENGIKYGQFRQWRYKLMKQREVGVQVTDADKKRIRQPKYQPIEDEMRQWMAGQRDPMSVPTKDIREKAMEIKMRLGVSGFSASDSWVRGFRERFQQHRPTAPELPAAAAAAAAAASGIDNTDGMTSEEEFEATVNQWIGAPEPDTHAAAAAVASAASSVPPASFASEGYPPQQGQADDESAADDGDGPLDQQSPSQRNTTSMEPFVERLTNQRGPPTKIHKPEGRDHREGPPSLLPRSSARSVVANTAEERLTDTLEDVDYVIDMPDDETPQGGLGLGPHTQCSQQTGSAKQPHAIVGSCQTAAGDTVTVQPACSTVDGVNGDATEPIQLVEGSSLSAAECAALRSLVVPSEYDECEFTLLYRASRDGPLYSDFLRCVGDARGLVFIVRDGDCVVGGRISDRIKLPENPAGVNHYVCSSWCFSLAGLYFDEPTKIPVPRMLQDVCVAGQKRTGSWGTAEPMIGLMNRSLSMGYGGRGHAANMRRCCIKRSLKLGDPQFLLFAGWKVLTADELEVIHVDGRSLPPLKAIDGCSLSPFQCGALHQFLRPATECSLSLVYRATRDGCRYADLLRCVDDAKGLVFVIRKDEYVFGACMADGIKLPETPTGKKKYETIVWHFSLPSPSDKPAKMMQCRQQVCVAGREGAGFGMRAKLRIGGCGGLWLGYGCYRSGPTDDLRSCQQFIRSQHSQCISSFYAPEGYVGPRDDRGNALFGGSKARWC
ncbi:unnamed protein product [Vitrella brassicaformis CCMP3155]|uniref:HTH CENPB-type domain-containing protein n=1 Tax=Vitrella brassicaformis (strain CCMP3155) TaxID=1169540 RepID=A0A0G4GEW4_VITBC|nr:unnamed protein product [Vitrella brassicaformis CCMP3155]|eukprot:CEM27972.1 unnamed protein product [Vitrella brassicaformis CCMP3155]